jgi:hypothetical protein
MLGHRTIEAGQRVTHVPSEYPSIGLVIASRPTALLPYGSSRVYRVTDIQGLEERSFTPGWEDTGYCESYVVAEELPLASAFGPHGAEVLALVERVERLTADEIVTLGELSLTRGGFASDLIKRTGWEVTKATGLDSAASEAGRRVIDAILNTALATRDDSLVDVFQGCERYLAIVHPTWDAAQTAAHHAVRAALFADALDAATIDEMTSIWRAFTGGDQAWD